MTDLKTNKKTVGQKPKKELQINLGKALKKVTSKLVNENEALSKKIDKWSKKLAKKISKEIKAHPTASLESEQTVKAVETEKPDVPKIPEVKKASVVKKKVNAGVAK